MRLQKYNFNNPKTGLSEDVYEYPSHLASPTCQFQNCTLVSRELVRIPILVVPNDYLEKVVGEVATVDVCYASFEFQEYYETDAEVRGKKQQFDDKIHKLQSLFSNGTRHQRLTKTTFFTGPKSIYKKVLDNAWYWADSQKLVLNDIGHFQSVTSLSIKNDNEVFITGVFECGSETIENTQCRIVLSRS
jgi:hypothetical protein